MGYLRLVPNVGDARQPHDDPCLEAFAREVEYIIRTLGRLGSTDAEIEDLCQEAYLALRRTWATYDPSRPIRPYLFGIAFRVTSSYRRRFYREAPRAFVEVEDPEGRPDTAFAMKQDRLLLLAALDRVPLHRRAVLIMHDFDEVPMPEIAATLSIPRFTAYSRLRKARRELASAVRRLAKKGTPR